VYDSATVVAVDLGGSKIVAHSWTLTDYRGQGTRANSGRRWSEAVIQRVIDAADRVIGRNRSATDNLCAISIGAAGPVDMRNGIVSTPRISRLVHGAVARYPPWPLWH